jgi:hypothetical protein
MRFAHARIVSCAVGYFAQIVTPEPSSTCVPALGLWVPTLTTDWKSLL